MQTKASHKLVCVDGEECSNTEVMFRILNPKALNLNPKTIPCLEVGLWVLKLWGSLGLNPTNGPKSYLLKESSRAAIIGTLKLEK